METFGIIVLVLGLVFGILGLVFLIINNASRKKAQLAAGWPVANGVVVKTDIKEHTSIDDDEGTTNTTYEPVVEYTYQVIGQSFTGRRIAFGANQFDRNTANKMVVQYREGRKVEVHYNPQTPEEAVLELTVAGGKTFQVVSYVFLAIGVVCILGGLFSMI